MRLSIDPLLILYFAFGLVLLYMFAWAALLPLRFIVKLAFNSLVGAVLTVVLCAMGVSFPLTPLSALITGLFGVPGIAAIMLIRSLA